MNLAIGWLTQTVWRDWGWLIRAVLIVALSLVARSLLLLAVRRLVRQVVKRADAKSSPAAESSPIAAARLVQRTKTIGSVLGNIITWGVAILAVSLILSELGVAVGALVAGAGLLGAGLGFGAQNLIRDLLSGLFIVFEDQYGVGDVVDLGIASGVVESVGLRVTQLRDVDGTVWYVRNGEISRVGNKSQGWSRIIIDLALDAKSDVAKAEEISLRVAKTVAAKNKTKVIGEPEVWGVQAFNGTETTIRLIQQARPNHSDEVSRQLLIDLKSALDEAKITLAPKNIFLETRPKK